MPKRVRINGVIHQFPDEATPEMIAEVLGVEPPDNDNTLQAKQQTPEQLGESIGVNHRTPLDAIRDLVSGVLTGMGKGGQFIGELPQNIPGYEKLQNAVQSKTGVSIPRANIDEAFAGIASPNKSIGGEILKGMGKYAPYAAFGGASLVGQAAAGAAAGAALTNPNEKGILSMLGLLPEGRTGGAIEGALTNTLTHGALKGLEAMRQSKMFRGKLSAEELRRNLSIAKGTETGLGDVIESPFLKKKLENTLTAFPFSGANESLQRTGKKVVDKGKNILERLLGDKSPENVPSDISDELIKQFQKNVKIKNNLYDAADKIASESNLKIEFPRFSSHAKKTSEAIEEMNLLKSEPDIKKIYEKIQKFKNPSKEIKVESSILDVNGKPIHKESTFKSPSLKEANILAGKLGEYSREASKSPLISERNTAKVYGNLSRKLKKDIRTSIDKSGNDKLKSAFESAEKEYSENFSPFLEKDIHRYISGNADPETIVQKFIKTSPTQDLANQLGKLAEKMPPQSRDHLAYAYLSRALDNEGNLNPLKMATAIKKLGKNQLKTLVPDVKLRKELLDYSKFARMNQESLSLMANPKTGQRNQDILTSGLLTLLGLGTGGAIGTIAAPAAGIMIGKLGTKALTSEKVRNSLVREMLKNRNKFSNPSQVKSLQTFLQSLQNNNGSQ